MKTFILLFACCEFAGLAQVPVVPARGFCPPPGARVEPPVGIGDDICNALPANSYRMQEQAAPLSFRQKASYFAQNKIFSGSAVFGAAFMGAIAQARHDPPQWPQGAEGFGDRFGTRYAQSLTKSTAEFLFGFREDPRSNPPPQPRIFKDGAWRPNPNIHSHRHSNAKFGERLGRALLGVVWTHYDSGRDGIAFSRVGGAFASGVIGIAWTPEPTNTWGQVGTRTASAFGGYAAGAVFHEFQPEVTKILARLTGQGKTTNVNGPPPPKTK
jgi:hypothetical protein